jgi:hypothetical protein
MADINDYTIEQDWTEYSEDEHAIWRFLFERQQRLLKRRACCEYHDGLRRLSIAASGIPDLRQLSDALDRATGWRIVAVIARLRCCRTSGRTPCSPVSRLCPPAQPPQKGRAARRHGPRLGRKRLEDVRQNHKRDPCRTAQFSERSGKVNPLAKSLVRVGDSTYLRDFSRPVAMCAPHKEGRFDRAKIASETP